MSTAIAFARPYACEHCEKRFKDALTHKRHTNVIHTKEESHVCDHCAAVFYTKHKLDVHLAAKHGINDQHKCDKCKKFLMSEWTLITHKRRCSTIPCPVCGKEFLSRWKLQNHANGHSNNRCHICDECGKDFLHNFTLIDHIEVVHQGKRPYQCDGCPKTFSRKGSLRAHKLIHSGIKPFPCQLCEKKFREKVQLIKHLKSKHRIEEHQLNNYVKLTPKRKIVSSEEMQNVMAEILRIKTEPMDVLNSSVESTREEIEIKKEITMDNDSTKNIEIKPENRQTYLSPEMMPSEMKKPSIKTEPNNLMDENSAVLEETTAMIEDMYGGSTLKSSADIATPATTLSPNKLRLEESMDSFEEDSLEDYSLNEDLLEGDDSLDEDSIGEYSLNEDAIEEDFNEEEFTFENIEL
eukprot:GFUD01027018.1.p1 GENE.GFUD01027018.1~~GFUD01027018.1.p1  ORF type:complete len:408 (+),score=82.77 GFUD01027018.1:67-1290(+)